MVKAAVWKAVFLVMGEIEVNCPTGISELDGQGLGSASVGDKATQTGV